MRDGSVGHVRYVLANSDDDAVDAAEMDVQDPLRSSASDIVLCLGVVGHCKEDMVSVWGKHHTYKRLYRCAYVYRSDKLLHQWTAELLGELPKARRPVVVTT